MTDITIFFELVILGAPFFCASSRHLNCKDPTVSVVLFYLALVWPAS